MKLDKEEIISSLKKFARRANQEYSDEIDNFRKSRNFAGGEQNLSLSKSRMKSKANLIPRLINTIVNPVKANPYSVEFTPVNDVYAQFVDKIKEFYTDIYDKSNMAELQSESLKDAVTSGLGGFYVTTVSNEYTKQTEVQVNLIFDPAMIIRDPFDDSTTGENSDKMAIVEIISKDKAKSLYGSDIASNWSKLEIDLEGQWHPKDSDSCQLITYYVKENDGIHFYKLIGDSIVQNDILKIKDIPVILVKGDIYWNNNKRLCRGITSLIEDVQTLINYTQSQAGQRMKRAPKNPIAISKRALEGNEDYYKDSDQNLTPVLPFNDIDSKGNAISPPSRFDNTVATDDLTNIMNMERSLLSDITGVSRDMGAVEQSTSETAEGLLLKSKSTESDISHFREHLKSSVIYMSKILLEFYAMFNSINVDEILTCIKISGTSGPELVTNNLETRRQLLALQGIIPDNMKGVVAWGITKTIQNPVLSDVSKMLFNLLPPEAFKDMPQIEQIQAQAAQQIQQLQSQLQALQVTNQSLTNQLNALSINNSVNIVTKKLDNENKIQLKAMDIQAKSDNQDKSIALDVAKAEKDSQIAEHDLAIQQKKADIEQQKANNMTINTKLSLLGGFR